jgi:hypothetical protein
MNLLLISWIFALKLKTSITCWRLSDVIELLLRGLFLGKITCQRRKFWNICKASHRCLELPVRTRRISDRIPRSLVGSSCLGKIWSLQSLHYCRLLAFRVSKGIGVRFLSGASGFCMEFWSEFSAIRYYQKIGYSLSFLSGRGQSIASKEYLFVWCQFYCCFLTVWRELSFQHCLLPLIEDVFCRCLQSFELKTIIFDLRCSCYENFHRRGRGG